MPSQKTKKALSPIFPLSQNTLHTKEIVFTWIPMKKSSRDSEVKYNLYIYPYSPKKKIEQIIREKPLHIVRNLKKPYYKFPQGSGKFRKNKAYLWRVEAKDRVSGKKYQGKIEGFRITSEPEHILNSDMTIGHPGVTGSSGSGGGVTSIQPDSTIRELLPNFYPHPPIIWGSPVKLRPIHPETDSEPSPPSVPDEDGGGVLEPIALIWGNEAALVFLIPSLNRHMRVFWDYSDVEGCDQVVLQITNYDVGFQDPNSDDAMSDTGVRAWYKGPAFIDHERCDSTSMYKPLTFEGDENLQFSPHDINVHYMGGILPTIDSDIYYLRLVPLNASGVQVAPASDHVTVVCVAYPGIELMQHSVQYEWGDSPLRRILFSIRLLGIFPSMYPLCRDLVTPVSFAVWSGSGRVMNPGNFEDVSFTWDSGVPLPTVGTWFEEESRFFEIDDWEEGRWLTFYYEQRCSDLVEFTDLRLAIYCIPGISLDWTICTGKLTDDDRPQIGSSGNEACENAALSINVYEDGVGMRDIYDIFTSELTGTKISGEGEEVFVDIRFKFIANGIENLPDPQEFRTFAMFCFHSNAYSMTMEETIGGTTREYDFRWSGFDAEIRDIEDRPEPGGGYETPLYSGRIIYNPPRIELRFEDTVYRLNSG